MKTLIITFEEQKNGICISATVGEQTKGTEKEERALTVFVPILFQIKNLIQDNLKTIPHTE